VNPSASTGAHCDDSAPPYGTLIFDCDSTLSGVEGIDELAGPRKPEISRLTERAMAGEVPLEAVYGKRLEMLRPDRAAVEALGRKYVAAVLPHAREVCDALHSLGKRTCIVSGGLRRRSSRSLPRSASPTRTCSPSTSSTGATARTPATTRSRR
jgi:hypothetical protein